MHVPGLLVSDQGQRCVCWRVRGDTTCCSLRHIAIATCEPDNNRDMSLRPPAQRYLETHLYIFWIDRVNFGHVDILSRDPYIHLLEGFG